MKKTKDEKIEGLSINVDKKLDALSLSMDSKFDELGAMIARGFTAAREELLEMRDELKNDFRKLEIKLEKHMQRSEKGHTAFNKRVTILERLQNI